MCEESFERSNWIIKDPNRRSTNVRLDESGHAHTHVFLLPSVRKIIGLRIISIASSRSSISDGRIHFGAIGGAIPSERNGRKESGREKGANLRKRERNKKKRIEGGVRGEEEA